MVTASFYHVPSHAQIDLLVIEATVADLEGLKLQLGV